MKKANKYKIKQIISGKKDNLSINLDCDSNFENVKKRFAVVLYTPDMEDLNQHYHIKLTDKRAIELRNWLNEFLKMKGLK